MVRTLKQFNDVNSKLLHAEGRSSRSQGVVIFSQAIALANKEVEKVTSDKGKQRGQYRRRANTLLPIFVAMTVPDFFLQRQHIDLERCVAPSRISPCFFVHMVASNTTDCFELHGRSLEFLGVANVHVLKMFRVKKISLPGWASKLF